MKLYLDVEKDFDPIRDKAQDLLWPENQDDARWSDVADRYAEQAGMPWLPPKGLDTLKSIACNRGLWEDLGNGYVTKKPKKKTTSVQVIAESEPDDEGKVRLRVNPQNAGPAPRIHYAEDAPVSEASPQLKDQILTTKALRVNFLVVDPSGQYETGDPVTWSNKLVLRNHLTRERTASAASSSWSLPRATSATRSTAANRARARRTTSPSTSATAMCCCASFAEADWPRSQGRVPLPGQGQEGRAD